MNNLKKQYISTLIDALKGRGNVDGLIEALERGGFFESANSTKYHLCCKHGLLEHSMNVLQIALKLKDALNSGVTDESVAIAALLHDVGKMGDYGMQNYVPNMVRSKTKNKETGDYDMVQSEAEPYKTNSELLYLPHEIRSAQIAQRYVYLEEDEVYAINMHNGMYGDLKYAFSGKETPLSLIIHWADMWAARVVEGKQSEISWEEEA